MTCYGVIMSNRTIGTCSICGGAVTTPDIWMGVVPPIPSCSSCGAIPKHAHGPVIDMRRREPGVYGDMIVIERRRTDVGVIKKMSAVLEAQNANGWPRPGQFTHDDAVDPDCFGGSDFD